MNKLLLPFVSLSILLGSTLSVKADSPLTSTYFATYYYDYPMVGMAESAKSLNTEIMAFLADEKNPIDAQAAVVNAIGWDYSGTSNAVMFWDYLATAYGKTSETLLLDNLSANELMVYGYLKAMDNYFYVSDALPALELAARKNPGSTTIAIVLAMTRAQIAMDTNWCSVWT